MKLKHILFFLIAFAVLSFIPLVSANHCVDYGSEPGAYHDGGVPGGVEQTCGFDPVGPTNLQAFLGTITSFLYVFAFPVLALMVLWGAFNILTAEGKEERYNKGKKIIGYAVVGFIIIILSGGLGVLIKTLLAP